MSVAKNLGQQTGPCILHNGSVGLGVSFVYPLRLDNFAAFWQFVEAPCSGGNQ